MPDIELEQEEMSGLQEQAGINQGGGVTEMAQALAEKLAEFKQIIDSSPATTDRDREAMDSMMQNFVSLVESQLTQNPGEDPEEQALPGNDALPGMGGVEGVPLSQQNRQ